MITASLIPFRVRIRLSTCVRVVAIACAVVSAGAPPLAWAQNTADARDRGSGVSVEARAPASGYAGDTLPLEIVVNGSKNAEPPRIEIEGATVEYRGQQDRSSSFVRVENGRVTSRSDITTAYVYQIVPQKAGTLIVPPVKVTVDGATYTTGAVTIRVTEPAFDPDFRLEIALESADAFVGQPIAMTLTWLIPKPIRGFRMGFPVPPGIEMVSGPDPRPPGSRRGITDGHFVELEINGEQAVGELSKRVVGSDTIDTLTIRRVLIPRQAGKLMVGPVRIDFQAVVGERPPRFGDAPWDDRSILQREYTQSAPIELTVSPLPVQGRPADFTGLVGRYALQGGVTPASVSVGEPMSLVLKVTGPEPLSLLPPLDIASQLGSDPRLKFTREPLLPTVTSGAATYEAQVRARSAEIQTLPSIGFSYFDPAERRYKRAETGPMKISVRPGATISGDDEPEADGDQSSDAAAPAALPGGLAALASGPITHRGAGAGWLEDWRSAPVLGLVALGPLVALGTLTGVQLRRAMHGQSPRARLARAYRVARREIHRARGDAGSRKIHAITRYLAVAADRPAHSATLAELAEQLEARLSPASLSALQALVVSDMRRFAPGDRQGSSDEALRALEELHHDLRKTDDRSQEPAAESGVDA